MRWESLCAQVAQQFELPALRLLCYFDAEAHPELRKCLGPFEGFHTPVIGSGDAVPDDVKPLLFGSDGEFAFDNLIYVPASKYTSLEVSRVIILSHELQHFVQWEANRRAYQVNISIFSHLCSSNDNLKVWEIPYERDAMIVSVRVAQGVLGNEAVSTYIRSQTMEGDEPKRELWRFLGSVSSTTVYDWMEETDRLQRAHFTPRTG